ncbi:hypothetical protein CVT26_006593 [Gymnopilus dilepis]|uniref:Uncharacterized protein n=1 Tax=Gymnopilus dilepis TaxID=231916 RepID=A0A409Y2Z2_9AGAR|nr:hypothetical protein CVT26_006593 [Gymnopilus dilepis]
MPKRTSTVNATGKLSFINQIYEFLSKQASYVSNSKSQVQSVSGAPVILHVPDLGLPKFLGIARIAGTIWRDF